MTNEQIAAMANWTLEDFQDNALGAVARVRELAAAHLSLQRERDAAVRDLEKLMLYGESYTCDFCGKDRRLCSRECLPKWRGPQPEQVLAPADQSAGAYADDPVLAPGVRRGR